MALLARSRFTGRETRRPSLDAFSLVEVVVALAVMAPLAAVGYLVWVYYATGAELDRHVLERIGGRHAEDARG